MNIWFLFLLIGLATMIERLSFTLLLDKWKMPNWLTTGLKYVPVAVLLSLVSTDIFRINGFIDISLANPKIIGGVAATLFAWQTQKMSATIGAGMAAYLISRAFI